LQVAHLYVALVNFVLEVLNLAVPDHEDAVLDLKQVRLALDAPDVGGGTLLETLDGLALVLDDAVLSRMCTIITPIPAHTLSAAHPPTTYHLCMDSRDSEFKCVEGRLGGTMRGWRDHHLRFRLHLSFLRQV
jgi:hypothetical protein